MTLRKLLGLCEHEWETIATFALYSCRVGEENKVLGYEYHLRCKKCGAIKAVQIV